MKRLLSAAAIISLASACGGDSGGRGSGGCETNSDCDAGYVCSAGECEEVCRTQRDCPPNMLCVNELCTAPAGDALPEIQSIAGNDASNVDGTQILDGMLISGANLAEAVFELQAEAGDVALTVRSQAFDSAELVFPADVLAGEYVLVATNAAGSDQETVELTLPDMSGDLIVTRINDAATTELISADRLAGTQRRVTETCTGGQSIAAIAADGTVTCEPGASTVSTGAVPYKAGSGLNDTSLHFDGSDALGVATTTPTHRFEVAAGFVYSHTQDVLDSGESLPTPRCECDRDAAAKECGSADIREFHDKGQYCYDHSGNDDWAEYEIQPDASPPLVGLAATADGHVGVGTSAPAAALQVKSLAALDGHANGWTSIGTNSYYDGAWHRVDETRPGADFHMNPDPEHSGGQEFRFHLVDSDGLGRNIAHIGSERTYFGSDYVGFGTNSGGSKVTMQASSGHLQLRRPASESNGGKVVFLELFQSDTSPAALDETYPAIRFHHANRFWTRIEGRPDGIHIKEGNPANDIYYAVNASAFNTNSTRRAKREIRESPYGLAEVRQLSPVRFKYKADPTDSDEIGLIAEEVVNVLPEVVAVDEAGEPSAIDYSKLSVVLLEAVKQQQEQIESLERLRGSLERKLEAQSRTMAGWEQRLRRLEERSE